MPCGSLDTLESLVSVLIGGSGCCYAIVDRLGVGEVGRVLLDFAVAGLLKGYARLIETVDASGERSEVRDSRVPREVWRRIAEEGRGKDVWSTGTVRLAGSDR